MSDRVSKLRPLDSESEPPAHEVEEAVVEKGACGCSRCGLYRWYPPLMLGSTILAGVFCWMYITKPVFLSSPSERVMDAQPAVEERAHDLNDTDEPPTAESSTLDPAIAVLPGDPAGETKMVGEPLGEILGEELMPLVVKREGAPLFKPFVIPADVLGESPSDAEASTEDQDPQASTSEVSDEAEEEGEVVNLIASGEGGASSESEDYQVHASFMAEFSSAE